MYQAHQDGKAGKETGPWVPAGIAFIVASLLVGAFYLNLDGLKRANQYSADQSAAHIQRYADRQTNEACALGNLPERVKCIADAQNAAHDDKRDNDDLFAQRQMVIWAFAVAIGGLVSIPLTAAGVVFVWKNLEEMQRARQISQDSLAAAGRSADAAEKSLTELERPHIFVEGAKMESPRFVSKDGEPTFNQHPFVQYNIHNYGRSPAIIKEFHAQVEVWQTPPDAPELNASDTHKDEFVVGPSDGKILQTLHRKSIDLEMQNSISLGQVFLEGKEPTRFYIFGYVRYASVFGSVDEVGFCFEHLIQINKFIPCAESKYVYRKRNLDKSGEQPCHSGGPKSLSPLS